MKSFLLLAVLVVCAAALTEKEYQDHFTAWMQKYQKSYAAADFQSRYAIFKANLDYVRLWNSNNKGVTLDTNLFADLSNAEYRSIYLGTKVKDAAARLERDASLPTASTVGLPDSVDWRTSGAVTPIKNQGQCGSCWSFSTTGSVEGIHKISSGNLVSLSEQNLMDCSTAEGNAGCNGGLMDDAFTYIIKNNGIDTEASYPYTAADGTCHFSAANIGATIKSYKDIKSGSEDDLQTAAVQQPISVAIDASHNSFQLYSSGVYYEKDCSATQLDHGVLVIGYGTSGKDDYWLVKNSWGTSWGQEGYIWMSRNRKNNCGIATMASYPAA
jgi:cathepsin L